MKQKLQLVSLTVIILGVLTGILPVRGASVFSDIETTDWYYENVNTLMKDKRNIIQGYPDGSFRPLTKLTKDQFITMCVRAAGFNLQNADGYWALDYLDKARELGFIIDGEFSDFRSGITREEMSLIILRVVDYLEGPLSFNDLKQVNDVVLDSESFADEYESVIQMTYQLGIITGYPDFTFRPQEVLNRSEASAVIIRVLNAGERKRFDFDKLYLKLHGEAPSAEPADVNPVVVEEHLLGGSEWVDPTKVDDYTNAKEDWSLMVSDMKYSPSQFDFEIGFDIAISEDTVSGMIRYYEDGVDDGHLEDFETLLRRRLPEEDVEKVMRYLNEKVDCYSFLQHEEMVFYLGEDKYIVRLLDQKMFENTINEQSIIVEFNIWFRDDEFINQHEAPIIEIFEYEDAIIVR